MSKFQQLFNKRVVEDRVGMFNIDLQIYADIIANPWSRFWLT